MKKFDVKGNGYRIRHPARGAAARLSDMGEEATHFLQEKGAEALLEEMGPDASSKIEALAKKHGFWRDGMVVVPADLSSMNDDECERMGEFIDGMTALLTRRRQN